MYMSVPLGDGAASARGARPAAAPTLLEPLLANALAVERKANRLHECTHGTRGVRMTKKEAMNTRRQRLLKHPRVSPNGGFVSTVYRYIDNHRRHAMPAPGRPAGRQTTHVFGQSLDVVRRVLHVVHNVIGPCLRVFLAEFKAALGAFMRTHVIDRLPQFENVDHLVNLFWFGRLRQQGPTPAVASTEVIA
jgi:hypothetical protein